jgi:hypothetical protein
MMDNAKELEIIMELMEELKDSMEYNKDDFESRLGRKKPEIEVLKIEGDLEEMPEEDMEDESPMMMEPSEEDSLKQRIMKLRGE